MQKNVFDYIEYSFTKLFSKQFWNIVGSSLIVSFGMILVSSLGIIAGGYAFYMFMDELGSSSDMWLYGMLWVLILLLLLSIVGLFVRGWLAIVIPVRSIDSTEKMDFIRDWSLYKTHIGRYFSYILWYSLVILCIIIVIPLVLILMTALHPTLGWIFGVTFIPWVLYIWTRLYLTWYHMLSEGSGTFSTFSHAVKLTRGRAWSMFWKVFAFAIIVWLAAGMIEGIMSTLFSLSGWPSLLNKWAKIAEMYENDTSKTLEQIRILLWENGEQMILIPLIFWIFYSTSSVLSGAMFHIFYVRYYLDIREEHENEHSFVKSILNPSSPARIP